MGKPETVTTRQPIAIEQKEDYHLFLEITSTLIQATQNQRKTETLKTTWLSLINIIITDTATITDIIGQLNRDMGLNF